MGDAEDVDESNADAPGQSAAGKPPTLAGIGTRDGMKSDAERGRPAVGADKAG